jgi:hypothetical protein
MVRTQELDNSIDETLWVEINAKDQSFLVCNTYRAQWTDPDYWNRLMCAIELATQFNENIVLVGDLNSNLFCVNNNNLVDIMNIFVFKNVIDKPIRATENSSTLLDPIILSDSLNSIYSDVINIPRNVSDHYVAVAYIDCPKGISTTIKREIWQYDKIDMDKFDKYINVIDWNDKKGNFDDVADMCNEFTKTFLEIARDCIPTKEIVRENDKPWFNNTLRKEIRIRDRIRKKVLKHNGESGITK